MENPNFSNARYAIKNQDEIRRKAFESKAGYCSSYSQKMKSDKAGMPEPKHMRGEY